MSRKIEKAAANVNQFRRIMKFNFQAERQCQTLLARNHYVTTSIYMWNLNTVKMKELRSRRQIEKFHRTARRTVIKIQASGTF